jgi:hypothetical protein
MIGVRQMAAYQATERLHKSLSRNDIWKVSLHEKRREKAPFVPSGGLAAWG